MAGSTGFDVYAPLRPGAHVRVSVTGQVTAYDPSSGQATLETRRGSVILSADPAALTINTVSPDRWPPEPGDLWLSDIGLWFFYASEHDSSLAARNASGGYQPDDPAGWLLERASRLRLLHRLGDDA